MINAYSQRLLPPYSGQIQIVESERARALTLDSQTWEIQFLQATGHAAEISDSNPAVKGRYIRVAMVKDSDIRHKTSVPASEESAAVDERMTELVEYIAKASLPFPPIDRFECWLLDAQDQSPLALIFSCTQPEQIKFFPERPQWTALPAAVMPIDRSAAEKAEEYAPINYQLERLVNERAGLNPKAQWFTRCDTEEEVFPPLLVREDWQDQQNADLCQRYLQRQSPRLLMLHGLDQELRKQLEHDARLYALEVERFHRLYPEVIDRVLMDAIRVEARLRSATEGQPSLHQRRDGIHYL